jgi:predicted nucleic acid-binding protein
MEWSEVAEMLAAIRSKCSVRALTVHTHEHGIRIAERNRYSVFDSMIIAGALEAGCTTLYSEDMQHGQQIGTLTIRNPLAA